MSLTTQENIQVGQSINLASEFLNNTVPEENEYLEQLIPLSKKIYKQITQMKDDLSLEKEPVNIVHVSELATTDKISKEEMDILKRKVLSVE